MEGSSLNLNSKWKDRTLPADTIGKQQCEDDEASAMMKHWQVLYAWSAAVSKSRLSPLPRTKVLISGRGRSKRNGSNRNTVGELSHAMLSMIDTAVFMVSLDSCH